MRPHCQSSGLSLLFLSLMSFLSCNEVSPKLGPEAQGGALQAGLAADENASMRVTVTAARSTISSCSSCTHSKSHPESPALSIAHAGPGAGLSVSKEGDGAALLISGGRVELSADQGVLVMAAMNRVTAGERIEVASAASIVTLQAVPGPQNNALVIAKGREGQLLWLHNADDDPCRLADDEHAVIAAGAVRQLLFLGGKWRLVG